MLFEKNIIVAGNGTVEAAALADNKTAEIAEWDFETLEQSLAQLDFGGFDIMEYQMAKPGPKKGEGGRPRKPIDWEAVKKLCLIQCTYSEIGSFVGVSIDTLDDRARSEHKLTFTEFYKIHAEGGKSSLRRAMWKSALDPSNRNPVERIWLSKQHLGMRDRFEEERPLISPVMITWENRTVQLSTTTIDAKPKEIEGKVDDKDHS